MKFAITSIPLLERGVLVVYECGQQEAITFFREYCLDRDFDPPDLSFNANVRGWFQEYEGDFYVWGGVGGEGVLAHELTHVAFESCIYVDIGIDQELICRLIQFLKINIVDKLEEVTNET